MARGSQEWGNPVCSDCGETIDWAGPGDIESVIEHLKREHGRFGG